MMERTSIGKTPFYLKAFHPTHLSLVMSNMVPPQGCVSEAGGHYVTLLTCSGLQFS